MSDVECTRSPVGAATILEFQDHPDIMLRPGALSVAVPIKEQVAFEAYPDEPTIAALSDRLDSTFSKQEHKFGRDLFPSLLPENLGAIHGDKTPPLRSYTKHDRHEGLVDWHVIDGGSTVGMVPRVVVAVRSFM